VLHRTRDGYLRDVSADQERMREALKKAAVALKEGDVAYALGGGYAAWALGGPEPEHDVDFVVAEADAERAQRVLDKAGLRVEQPPEDWLFKVFDGDGDDAPMVDVLFRVAGDPVEPDLMERAQQIEVLSIRMPVLTATDLLVTKLLALNENSCDYGKVLPSARALREQVDWHDVRRRSEHNPYAAACLFLLGRLEVAPTAG
jgi:hypothetical protein